MLVLVLGRRGELLNDPDTYLHVAAGQWMLAHHALPVADPFSHSMAGAVWVPHEWLAELVFALAYDGAGWAGVVLATALAFALAMGLLTRGLLDRFEPLTGLIATISAAIILEPHLIARAHALALPLMVLWARETIAARDRGRAPSWWLLPVLVLWINLHASALAGVVLALYLGFEAVVQATSDRAAEARSWGLFGGLSLLATLCTPNGVEGVLLPFRLSAMPVLQKSFVEWQSPDFQHFHPLDLWIAALVLGLAAGLRLPVLRLVVVAALLFGTLAHQRHADLLAVMAPLLLGRSLGADLAARMATPRPSPVARFMARLAMPAPAAGLGLAVVLALLLGGATLVVQPQRTHDDVTPDKALAAARAAGLDGNLLNDEGFGGYLIQQGVPVFIDGRVELYGDQFLATYLAAMAGREPELDDVLERHHIAWAMLAPGSVAAQTLDHRPGWRRIYADKVAVVEARAP